jgi:hypothetical protein
VCCLPLGVDDAMSIKTRPRLPVLGVFASALSGFLWSPRWSRSQLVSFVGLSSRLGDGLFACCPEGIEFGDESVHQSQLNRCIGASAAVQRVDNEYRWVQLTSRRNPVEPGRHRLKERALTTIFSGFLCCFASPNA